MSDEKKRKEQELTNKSDDASSTTSPTHAEPTVPNKPVTDTWAADSQDELEDWIEEQGIQLRY